MSSRYSLARDLDEFELMTERLQDYVLSDTLYMSIGAGYFRGAATPQLTIGNLLLRRRRLSQLRAELDAKQDARLEAALRQHGTLQREWTRHYEDKLKQELPARLMLLQSFLYDCSENPRNCGTVYPVEALRRTVMQEILLALDEFGYDRDGAATQVDVADVGLRRVLQAGDFIWSADLETVYLRERFWWLYGSPAG